MSTIKSDDSNITINASGSGRDIKFQANGVEKASISSAGAFTSTTIDATKLTGDLPAISGANLTGVGVAGITSTADATAITIDSSENVGIGTTPETGWRSSSVGVDIGTGGAIAGYNGGSGAMQVLSNAYWNTSGGSGWKYKNSSYPATMLNSDGEFVFKTAGNGTADNAITWTTQLEIKEDGRGLSQFTARAWARIDQTGTQSITMSHNCSSVSDNGTGDSSINFTNNIGNTQYCVTTGNSAENEWSERPNPTVTATNYVRLQNVNHSSTFRDSSRVHCVVFTT